MEQNKSNFKHKREKVITCKHCGKDAKQRSRGLCSTCYSKLKENGDLNKLYPPLVNNSHVNTVDISCKADGCDKYSIRHGYCAKHWEHIKKYGYIKERTKCDPNEIIINNELSYAEILLYNIDGEEVERALIDIDDIDKVKKYKWSYTGNYVVCNSILKEKDVKLHRFVMNVYEEVFNYNRIIDHINRNTLDNRKSNLRIGNQQENTRNSSLRGNNTSGIIGVGWDKTKEKWQAYIKIDYKLKKLGQFKDFEEAVRVRLIAEKKYFGEFAPQKHLFEEYGVS